MIDFNHMTLEQKQTQQLNLVMTPALRQAIELLQYSTIDLYHHLKETALENPLMELEQSTIHNDPFQYDRFPKRSSPSQTENELQWIPDQSINKRDELIQLAKLQFTSKKMIHLTTYLIHNLDSRGYLVLPPSTPLTEAQIQKGISYLQQIGPPGLGARTVQECLQLQLQQLNNSENLQRIIREHFTLFTNRKWQELAKSMDLPLSTVKKYCKTIQQLQLTPMIEIDQTQTEYVIPDIIVDEQKGKLHYHLHDRYLPTVRVNETYAQMNHTNEQTKQYITDKMTQLHWLQMSMMKRRETISKIMTYMLHSQKTFFTKGLSALQPLTLQEVAQAINMHESTVSRATDNKVIQTPAGTFDFKVLFTSKMETVDGETISQQRVKVLLKQFIAHENKQKPLSDQKIALYFTENEGIVISRRTISKYREELNIPSSRLRKEI